MNGRTRFVLITIFIGITVGCRTAPTVVPIEAIAEAITAAGETVELANTAVAQAERLEKSLNALSISPEIKTAAGILVKTVQATAASTKITQKKVAVIEPVTEQIAEELDQAIEEKKIVMVQRNKAWLALAGLSAIIILAIFWKLKP